MDTVTWLHLSDFHFRAEEQHAWDENIVLKALLKDIVARPEHDRLRPDFVVVTGDIAYSGRSDEYALASMFFDELLQITCLSKDRLFLIPGNHDVDRKLVSRGATGIANSLTDRESVNAVLATPTDRQLMLRRFRGYASFVNDYLGDHLRFEDKEYLYVRTLDLAKKRIALFGLNSSWLCASDDDETKKLVLGERQVRTVLAQAANADLKIALMHHPFHCLRDFDRNDVEPLIQANCDFVLHGHLHRASLDQIRSPDTESVVVAGGACYTTRQYPNVCNTVQVDWVTNEVVIYFWRYSDSRGGFWAKDTLTYQNAPDGHYAFSLKKSSVVHDVHSARYKPPFTTPPPSRLVHFINREQERAQLVKALTSGEVCFLTGLGGVGKTTLALRTAHDLRDHFPDGVVWLSVEASQTPGTVLVSLLRVYDQMPDPQVDLSLQVRRLLQDKRALIVIDGAEAAPDATRILLECAGRCAVLVTTRDRLIARGYQYPGQLEPLAIDDASKLFTKLLKTEDPALKAIGQRLGRLPLAIEIAAGDMAASGIQPVEYLADLEQGALANLPGVQAAFQRSYELLSPRAQQSLAMIALLGGASFDLQAATAGIGDSEAQVRTALGELVRRCLLGRAPATGRYEVHPLVKEYAATLSGSVPEHETVCSRLVAHYVSYVQVHQSRIPEDYDALELELDNLSAIMDRAQAAKQWAVVRDLTWAVQWMLDVRGYWDERLRWLQAATQACEALDDSAGLATAYNHLGEVHHARGNLDIAMSWYERSSTLFDLLGDDKGLAMVYTNAGSIQQSRGHHTLALASYEQSASLFEKLGDQAGLARAYNNMGLVFQARGKFDDALSWHTKSLEIRERLGDQVGIARVHASIGNIYYAWGEYRVALDWFKKSQSIRERLGDRAGLAATFSSIGRVSFSLGEYAEALDWYRRSLSIFTNLQHRQGLASVLNHIGHVHNMRGEFDLAMARLEEARLSAEELGDRAGMATAYSSIGSVHYARQDYESATEWYQKSKQICEEVVDDLGLASLHNNFGNIHYARGSFSSALNEYEASLAIWTKFRHRPGVVKAYTNLGLTHFALKNYDHALRCHQQAAELSEQLGHYRELAHINNGIGTVHQNRGDSDEALASYEKAYDLFTTLGDQGGIAMTLHNIGLVHLDRENFHRAFVEFERSHVAYTALGLEDQAEEEERFMTQARLGIEFQRLYQDDA